MTAQRDEKKLTREAESKGVSGWVHPILSFPWNPIVLVEGSTDIKALTHAASIVGLGHIKFFNVPSLDHSEEGAGKDAIIFYLKRNAGLAQNRPAEAPLLVLFDWETSDQEIKKAKAAYGLNADKYVTRMNPAYCDAKLGEDFKGIERFYPSAIIESAHKAEELIVGMVDGKPFSVSKSQLDMVKGKLLSRVVREKTPKKLEPLLRVLLDLERAIRGNGPIQLTLFDAKTK